MDDLETLARKTTLNLQEAAQLAAAASEDLHDVEVRLAMAIERGQLHANIKRWATEQWAGRQLPGNMNRLETFIERRDLEAWLQGQPRAI